MARHRRKTLPQVTNLGKIASYEELRPLLIEAETRGRLWAYERASSGESESAFPSDNDVLRLHREMFEPIYAWAGQTRREARGPGGREFVPWHQVRIELRERLAGLDARFTALREERDEELDTPEAAELVAATHHAFQYIHPFADTNGRTGRVLDHYILWVTLGLAGPVLQASPFIDHFETPDHEREYFKGLAEADAGYLDRLEAFYAERIEAAVSAAEEEDGAGPGGY